MRSSPLIFAMPPRPLAPSPPQALYDEAAGQFNAALLAVEYAMDSLVRRPRRLP